MTNHDKNLILQGCSLASVFLKEADLASAGHTSQVHDAARQLTTAIAELPSAIEGCSCGCVKFQKK
jgi:hypothetical protein